MEIFERFDLVVLPFPFTDRSTTKRRPALVISTPRYQEESGHIICAMITTAAGSHWPSDTSIEDWEDAGLPKASKLRMKLFTLDAQFVLRRLGKLSSKDSEYASQALGDCLTN
ncbi:type II toxin-antitoxin system PemK/MazF family toxin [Coraliomargarita sp. W4R53]